MILFILLVYSANFILILQNIIIHHHMQQQTSWNYILPILIAGNDHVDNP